MNRSATTTLCRTHEYLLHVRHAPRLLFTKLLEASASFQICDAGRLYDLLKLSFSLEEVSDERCRPNVLEDQHATD